MSKQKRRTGSRPPASMAERGAGAAPDAPLAFLIDHWETFAVLAYASYLEAGRGLVLMDIVDEQATAAYISARAIETTVGGWPDSATEQRVRTYTPAHEVVFVVLRNGAGARTYWLKGRGDASPLAAYQRWRETTPTSSA